MSQKLLGLKKVRMQNDVSNNIILESSYGLGMEHGGYGEES